MLGIGTVARKVFGTPNDRKVKTTRPLVEKINALEPEYEALDDAGLIAKTQEFKTRIADGEKLDAILPEAFANCREAARRALGLRAFDVQLMGGIFLHQGNISEMKTGEGKTLVATFPAYLNALTGKGVHIVTVNDYLAKRDAEWMGNVFSALGMTTGVVYPQQPDDEKKGAYAADITYATNNELGFDYLRDNMKSSLEEMAQRGHNFAIVDEVDSILIDEARTPLIISGPAQDRSELYVTIDGLIPSLEEDHYKIDEKTKNVTFTDEGNEYIEELLHQKGLLEEGQSLYDPESTTIVHHMNQGLRAHKLFLKDRDYIVRDNEVVLIDEFTGRMMAGRRLSDGLHQAIEAKEGCEIKPENVTLAQVTFQNYFRLYDKLSGMTGTATTEAEEFGQIYGLGVVEVPTNKPIARVDEDDAVYRTAQEKFDAIVTSIKEAHEKGQPILVGTTSIDKSEMLSELLKKAGVKHNVLNARQHEKEAQIVADAGKLGAVTIATNMAGRGTDIKLGGNLDFQIMEAIAADPEADTEELRKRLEAGHKDDEQAVIDAGGLFVLATERHESRRIDNQLRGRSGRQGDPGRSAFFLSLDDDLMRIFGSERLEKVLSTLGMKEGEAIIHPWVNKSLERAQAKVEGRNFDIRKQLLKFDDVMNEQRKGDFPAASGHHGGDRPVGDRQGHAWRGDRRPDRPVHAAQDLCRPVGHGRALCRGDRAAEPGRAGDGLGRRGRRGRRRGRRPAGRSRRRDDGRKDRGVWAGTDADDRKAGPASDHRQQMARAPVDAGTPAQRRGFPWLCAARPAERVQERGVPAVRDHAGQPAAGRDPAAGPDPPDDGRGTAADVA